jgi:phosphatidylglycerophosphate synthase
MMHDTRTSHGFLEAVTDSQPLEPELLRWSAGHAAAMTVVTLAMAGGLPLPLVPVAGAVSFAILLYRCRGRWAHGGRFGPGNAVTLLRLCGVLVLPWFSPGQVFCWGLLLFALDGMDGWVARRTGLAGEFGEFFDKESDACFVLVLCVLLYRLPGSGFGAWILLPGLLRYAFVLFVALARPPQARERRNAKARWILVLTMLALLSSFAAYPGHLDIIRPLTGLMTLVLACSFAASVYELYRSRLSPERT